MAQSVKMWHFILDSMMYIIHIVPQNQCTYLIDLLVSQSAARCKMKCMGCLIAKPLQRTIRLYATKMTKLPAQSDQNGVCLPKSKNKKQTNKKEEEKTRFGLQPGQTTLKTSKCSSQTVRAFCASLPMNAPFFRWCVSRFHPSGALTEEDQTTRRRSQPMQRILQPRPAFVSWARR